jgi:antirestriction protein ArdC
MPSVYEVITNRITEQLEAGTAPWHKPWRVRGKNGLPRNLVTMREYRGVNVWILLSTGFSSPYWLTYRQAQTVGGHVRMGEKGLPVVYWKFGTREVEDGDGVIEKPSVLCRQYTVFNIEQCEGLRLKPPCEEASPVPPIEACERVVAEWQQKPMITSGTDVACYNKRLDLVQMPDIERFDSSEEFYSTLFHELCHSTGHPKRLNRSTLTNFERYADNNYTREELVAEMGAAFLCGITGIEARTLNNSAAYVHNWLKALKDDSRIVLVAASQAQKATDLIRGVSPTIAM